MFQTFRIGNGTAAVCGLIFAAFSAAIFPAAFPNFPPALGAAAADIAAYYASHGHAFRIANYIGVLAMPAGLVKITYLAEVFSSSGSSGRLPSRLVFGSGLFALAVGTGDLVAFQAVTFPSDPGFASATKAVSDLASAGFALFLVAQFTHVAAIAWAAAATGALPRWVSVTGAIVAAVSLAGSLGANFSHPTFFSGGGPMSGIALGVFLAWYSVLDLHFLRVRALEAACTNKTKV